jgi:hypothetical protein
MKRSIIFVFLLSCTSIVLGQTGATSAAASKFLSGINWKEGSVVTGDFSCRGRVEHAILGTSKTEIVVAVFLDGLSKPPQVLRYSAKTRDPSTSELKVEDGDFDPKEFEDEVGYIPDGMRPSKSCKGLNVSDGKIDSAHIYWNHDAKQFSDWVL